MNVYTTLLLYAVACVILLEAKKVPLDIKAPAISLESASFSSSQGKSDLEQDHRNLQSCSEDDAFFVITSCENVCGVSGLTFAAELFSSLCEFVSDEEGAVDAARALGCPNVNGNFFCSYGNLRDEIDGGNLDIMCDFCAAWAGSSDPAPAPTRAPTSPSPVTTPTVLPPTEPTPTPGMTPLGPIPTVHPFFGGIGGPPAPSATPPPAMTPPPVTSAPTDVVATMSSPVVEQTEPPTALTMSKGGRLVTSIYTINAALVGLYLLPIMN